MENLYKYPEIIDKILSYDNYPQIDLILAFNMHNYYIDRYSKLTKNIDYNNPGTIKNFKMFWILDCLIKKKLYEIDQNILNNISPIFWEHISQIHNLKKSFIITNKDKLNLSMVKYYKKGKFSKKIKELPNFENINKCTKRTNAALPPNHYNHITPSKIVEKFLENYNSDHDNYGYHMLPSKLKNIINDYYCKCNNCTWIREQKPDKLQHAFFSNL